MKKKEAIILLFMCFFSGRLYGKGVKEVNYYISNAEEKLMSSDHSEKEQGVHELQSITGISPHARYSLGRYLVRKSNCDGGTTKKGFQLIYSAYYADYPDAGYYIFKLLDGSSLDGCYIKRDEKKAMSILKHAIAVDNHVSPWMEFVFGKALAREASSLEEKKEALYWLERSVQHGENAAYYDLAKLYAEDGPQKDMVKAWCYSDLNGSAMAMEKDDIEKKMTPEQIERAQKMSWDWQDAHHMRMPGYRRQSSPIHWQVN